MLAADNAAYKCTFAYKGGQKTSVCVQRAHSLQPANNAWWAHVRHEIPTQTPTVSLDWAITGVSEPQLHSSWHLLQRHILNDIIAAKTKRQTGECDIKEAHKNHPLALRVCECISSENLSNQKWCIKNQRRSEVHCWRSSSPWWRLVQGEMCH